MCRHRQACMLGSEVHTHMQKAMYSHIFLIYKCILLYCKTVFPVQVKLTPKGD